VETTYQLTKKQSFFQRNVDNLVKQQIRPLVEELDRQAEFPFEALRLLGQNRLLGLLAPPEAGGEGAGFLDVCLALEGLARACPFSALIVAVQNLGVRLLATEANPAQREKHLPALLAGEAVFGYAMPDASSLDLDRPPLEVRREGKAFVLSGSGCFVVNADAAEVICLFAREGNSVHGFLVGRGLAGMEAARSTGTAGAEARSTCRAKFQDCRLSLADLLDREGAGGNIAGELLNQAACFTAARALGMAQGALDYARLYARQREQFGRPIGQFQAVQMLLAGMTVKVEASRQLVYKAAAVLDQAGPERRRFASLAKCFATQSAAEACADAVQVAGGYGYTRDYPLERLMRNAHLAQLMDGGNQAHLLALARG